MTLTVSWMSWRWTTSQRSLVAILIITILSIGIHFLFTPHLLRALQTDVANLPFDIDFHFDLPMEIVELHPNTESEQAEPANLQRPLGAHTVTPDGLLVVNPDGPHPIFQLIRDAQAAWEAKCARASKSLDQAVAEYKRRYRRAPPLGFDKWWEYVAEHDVQLPDEYDEIFEDIEPFWGLDPTELARTQQEFEKRVGVVTIEKTDTYPQLEVAHSTLTEERQQIKLHAMVDSILAIVRDVEENLPPLRFTLSPFDNPNMLSDWRIKAMAREAAANGKVITGADLPEITESGWIQACPPDSPARLNSSSTTLHHTPSSPKTFIAAHRETMDPCVHPSLLSTHGQFLSNTNERVPQGTLVPRFSLCATLLHHDIRPPVPYEWDWESNSNLDGAFEGDLPWERKVDERLGWRGRTTGMHASPDRLWVNGHRARLVTLTNALEGNVSMLQVGGADVPVGEPKMVRLTRTNPAWMDIAFTDKAIQCDETGGTCGEMETLWEFRRVQKRNEEGRYKFIFDVDGNGWSGRFKRLITSNALIFKATIYPEWYLSRIAPWVHYVPIQISYTDLHDAVAFFRVHDGLGAQIAKAGRDWSRQFWRREDMTAYMYRLLLEYARVSSLDRASMDYVG